MLQSKVANFVVSECDFSSFPADSKMRDPGIRLNFQSRNTGFELREKSSICMCPGKEESKVGNANVCRFMRVEESNCLVTF